MDPLKRKILAREREKQSLAKSRAPDLEAGCFPLQRALVRDSARRIAVDCGRRSGKTVSLSRKLFITGMKFPRSTLPVLELTKSCQAAIAFWQNLKGMDEDLGLGIRFNDATKVATLPNYSRIPLIGADQTNLVERLRGDAYPMVAVDESGHFRPSVLRYLLEEAIEPATMDYDGQIVLVGTPNVVPQGPFYEACHNDEWSHHHWTMFDNPHVPKVRTEEIPDARAWLERLMKQRGWSWESPVVKREYLGEWVHDLESVVYKWDPARNRVDSAPEPGAKGWRWVLGIDLGYEDSTAFVVVAYRRSGEVVVVESYKQRHLIPSAVATHVEKLQQRYQFSSIVADTGGIGKAYSEELRQRYNVPVMPAQKRSKFAFIEMLNGDLASGRLKVYLRQNQELVEEMQLLMWDDKNHQKVSDRFDDHLCDALLYAWRDCHSGLVKWEKDPPTPGTAAYWEKYEEELLKSDPDMPGNGPKAFWDD